MSRFKNLVGNVRHWFGRRPRFSVSVEIRDTPDWLCHLTVSNPGPTFALRTARLVSPRDALIYRREKLLWEDLEGTEFTQIRLDREVCSGETVSIPFELWMPRTDRLPSVRLSIRTTRRPWPYRSLTRRLRRGPPPEDASSEESL